MFTLAVVGALIGGTFFMATHEQRTGTDVLSTTRALSAAELGVDAAMAGWNREWNVIMRRGDRRAIPAPHHEGATATVEITRLDNQLFVISSEGRSGPARRVVRRFVALSVAEPMLRGAAMLGGSATIEGTTQIDGTDRSPDGWMCPDPGPALAGVATPDSILVSTSACTSGACVAGSPPIHADSALREPSTFLRLGDLDWSDLVQRANVVADASVSPAPVDRDGVCDVENPRNWGEPRRTGGGVCLHHFPVIHAPADLTIDGGRGQGILLVEGDLTIQGGFTFSGIVMVRGALRTATGGGRLTGALSIAATDSSGASSLRDLAVQLSGCAVYAAMVGSAVPLPVIERSWFEVVGS